MHLASMLDMLGMLGMLDMLDMLGMLGGRHTVLLIECEPVALKIAPNRHGWIAGLDEAGAARGRGRASSLSDTVYRRLLP